MGSRVSLAAGALALVALCAGARPAMAEDKLRPPARRYHIPVTVGFALTYALAEGPLKDPLSADTCRWCGPMLFDAPVRDALIWRRDTRLAHHASNVTGYAGASLWGLGGVGIAAHLSGHGAKNWLDDGLVVAESAAFAGLVNFAIKAMFARERPFVHALPTEDKPNTDFPQDNNQSYYSGHATYSMALAVSAGTVARLRGYRHAPHVYGVGITLSLATGYFRIAADKHWATDVVSGWVLGAAFGYAVPMLFHKKSPVVDVVPVVSPSSVGFAMRW